MSPLHIVCFFKERTWKNVVIPKFAKNCPINSQLCTDVRDELIFSSTFLKKWTLVRNKQIFRCVMILSEKSDKKGTFEANGLVSK